MKFNEYNVKIKLTRDMLGTNPIDPQIMETHVINKQRELILEKSKVNSEINKYLDQLPIAQKKSKEEVEYLMDKLEELLGIELDTKKRAKILAEGLDALKETMTEMELRGTTVFFWNKKLQRPMIGDHMIYGFLKAATEAIGRTLPRKHGTVLHSVAYTQSLINQHVRIDDQFLVFDNDLKRNKDGSTFYFQRSLRAQTAQGPRVSLVKSEVVEAGARLDFTLVVADNSPITEEVLHELFSYGRMTGLGQWRNAGWGMFSYQMKAVGASGGKRVSSSAEATA